MRQLPSGQQLGNRACTSGVMLNQQQEYLTKTSKTCCLGHLNLRFHTKMQRLATDF